MVGLLSRPAWARGLKLLHGDNIKSRVKVAPRVGAWIETDFGLAVLAAFLGRAPRGRVD